MKSNEFGHQGGGGWGRGTRVSAVPLRFGNERSLLKLKAKAHNNIDFLYSQAGKITKVPISNLNRYTCLYLLDHFMLPNVQVSVITIYFN